MFTVELLKGSVKALFIYLNICNQVFALYHTCGARTAESNFRLALVA